MLICSGSIAIYRPGEGKASLVPGTMAMADERSELGASQLLPLVGNEWRLMTIDALEGGKTSR